MINLERRIPELLRSHLFYEARTGGRSKYNLEETGTRLRVQYSCLLETGGHSVIMLKRRGPD